MVERQKLFNNPRLIEVLVHVVAWLLIFGFPLVLMEYNSFIKWNVIDYLRQLRMPLAFGIVFYTNYFWLASTILTKQGRKSRAQGLRNFLFYNFILLSLVGLLIHFSAQWLYPQLNIPLPPPSVNRMRPGASMLSPRLIFYVRNITLLGFTAALAVVIRMSREWRKAEEARREAENARTDAELKTLRNQLSPHFLLNTLNNIYALIAFDTDKAQTAVLELSKMLRHMLYDNHQKFVPLQSEADFIRNYVELMRLRLSHEVKVEVDIKVDSGRNTQIAPLIFISLVENAFKHGISPTEPSFVRINLFEENEYVHCNIKNSNFPKNREDKSGSGIGLEQVKRRLELLYPDCYKWTRSTMEEGRVYVSDLIIKTNHDSELCNN